MPIRETAMSQRTIVILLIGIIVPPAWADGPSTALAADRATALVKQLGDRSFKVRERASQALVELGPAAVPALQAGCKAADPEVRRRCLAILPLARKRDQDRLLRALLADKDGKGDYALPDWPRYRKLVGKDLKARRLYVDMVRVHGDWLAAAIRDPAWAAQQANSRYQLWQRERTTVSLVDLATLVFVGTNERVGKQGLDYGSVCRCLEDLFPNCIDAESRKERVRPLLRQLVRQGMTVGQTQPALRLAFRLELKETAELAAKQLESKGGDSGDRAMAAYVLGKLGSKKDLSRLASLLNDRRQFSSFSTGGVQGTTEVGDVALASLVRLTGQDLGQYGYPAAKLDEWSLRVHAAAILGFPSDAVRATAKKRWRTWAAKNHQPQGPALEEKAVKS